MGLGFTSSTDEVIEDYIPLYKTVIECPQCGDKDLMNVHEGHCSCKNLYISVKETITDVRFKSKFKDFKTVTYKEEKPLIYEVLLIEEIP